MKFFVDANAKKSGKGSAEFPFKKIGEAAKIARAGDEILVSPGIYREYVDPKNSGTAENRIVYRSVEKGGAVICGSEPVKNWQRFQGDVWFCEIPNGIFGGYNPFTTLVQGDWFIASYVAHTGDVFLNGKSMYESVSLEGVLNPQVYEKSWDKEFSLYKWFAEQDEKNSCTKIFANFRGKNPNEENVEISVRENCFYPSAEKISYITLSGFTVRQAATQWAPPTAYQEGMIGPHWSKGWIIEDCDISESKCSGISLGKYFQPQNDNKWLKEKFKDGTQTERDCICRAQKEGWSKENIGSHIVRRCNIHDCGQTGIVGHLGGVFSVIEDNHIHHINNKQNLAGAEIGGIKMHAAIDVIIRRNHIHHCTRGLWLDWQAQGTRVTQNFFHDNCLPLEKISAEQNGEAMGEDIFIEVSHGPTLIDNNVLLSDESAKLPTQGAAFIHNLICGSFTAVGRGVKNGALTKESARYTPYHFPHETEIAGFMTILHGDMRFVNNIFVQKEIRSGLEEIRQIVKDMEWTDGNLICGTVPYENFPTEDEWKKQFDGYCGMGSEPSDRYYNPLPVHAEGNFYFNGARPVSKEKNATVDSAHKINFCVKEKNGKFFLQTNLFDFLERKNLQTVSTEFLGEAFEPEQKFENPDGSPIVFDSDYFENHRGVNPMAGPFENPQNEMEM
jgi:hypothetical protein